LAQDESQTLLCYVKLSQEAFRLLPSFGGSGKKFSETGKGQKGGQVTILFVEAGENVSA
jgi:hypothetical protein